MKFLRFKSNSDRDRTGRYDRVCVVQVGDRHTELLGYFLSHFAESEVDLVHRFESQYSYIGFYERLLGNRFARVLREYDHKTTYDLVILLTSNEAPMFRVTLRKRIKRLLGSVGLLAPSMHIWMGLKKRLAKRPDGSPPPGARRTHAVVNPTGRSTLFRNSRQTIAICHLLQNMTTECRNLAFSPLVRQLPWLLPVTAGLPIRSASARERTICCMGLLEERYYQIIPELARAMPDTTFRLFVRQAHPKCMALLSPLANVAVAIGEGTDSMMEYLASSRYLLILDHEESRYRQDRLSGAIPLGLNLAVPMVMSSELAQLYDIRAGVVTYPGTPDAGLAQRLASITPAEYERLVADMVVERTRMAQVASQRFSEFLRGEGDHEREPALARANA
jgi:hypothetical protein